MTAATEFQIAGRTVEYNGVQIGGAESAFTWYPPKVTGSVRLQYDDADRAVILHVFSISVSTVVIANDMATQDEQMAAIRRLLSEPGRPLSVSGIGIGLSSNVQDYAWGPKPRLLELKPLCHLAWSLVWQVEVATYACSNVYPHMWESFSFTQDWSIDMLGKTVRTISGVVRIPRHVSGIHQRTADMARNAIRVDIPEGFQRISQRYAESPDKKELRFSVVDRELLDGPYPAGIVHATGSRSLQTKGPAFSAGSSSLGMALTVAPGVPRSIAALHFFKEVLATQKRLNDASQGRQSVIPRSLSISHELWGRTTSFSFTWEVFGCLMDLLLGSSLYEPVADTDYTQWRQSVEHTWDQRGMAGLSANPADDAIISICSQVNQAIIGTQRPSTIAEYPTAPANLFCEGVTEERSWIQYESVIRYKTEQGYAEHSYASNYIPPEVDPAEGSGYVVTPWSGSEPTNTVEYNGIPRQRILLQWKGMRLKFKPEPPRLISIGGRKATMVRRWGEGPRVIAMALDCPVYFERVSIEYVVTEPISRLEPIRQRTICHSEGQYDQA